MPFRVRATNVKWYDEFVTSRHLINVCFVCCVSIELIIFD